MARWYVTSSSEEARDIRREYGDPDLLMRQVASSVLGRGYRIRTEDGDETESGPEKTRQDELEQWSEDEQMELKLLENEHNALSLGDSVLWFSYSGKRSASAATSSTPASTSRSMRLTPTARTTRRRFTSRGSSRSGTHAAPATSVRSVESRRAAGL